MSDNNIILVDFDEAEFDFSADSYDEKRAGDYMANDKIDITVDLCLQPGTGTATVWTCDLTKQYIAINADYRS